MEENQGQKLGADLGGWLFGIGIPLALACVCLRCIITQTAVIPTRHGYAPINFHGIPAIVIGIFLLFLGAYIHFKVWWGVRRDDSGEIVTEWGVGLSLVGLVLSSLYIAWSMIALFWQ